MRQFVHRYKSVFVEGRFTSWILLIVVMALRATMLLHRGTFAFNYPDTGYVWKHVAPYFSDAWSSFVASSLFLFLIALLLRQIDKQFLIIRTRTSLPFTVALIFFSIHPFFLTFTPDFIALFFVLLAFFPLLSSYQEVFPEKQAFKIGILLALAAIFQVYTLLLIPVFWMGEVWMRGFRFRAFFASIFGMLMVFFGVFAGYFFFDHKAEFFQPFTYFSQIDFPDFSHFSIPQCALIGITALSIIVFIILDYPFFSHGKVLSKKTIDLLIWMIFFSIAFQIMYGVHTLFFLYLVSALFAFIVAHYFSYTTSSRAVVSFFLLTGVAIIVYLMNYGTIFFPLH